MLIRQPTSSPVNDMMITVRTLLTTSAVVLPTSTAEEAIGRERNRSMIPLLRSCAMPEPVMVAPKMTVWAKIPAMRNSR